MARHPRSTSIEVLTAEEEARRIEATIESLGDGLTILEAGCGRRWKLKLSVQYRLVGIDTDAEALATRCERAGDLDDYQVGDLCNAHFESQSFDVIYCSYVLEHVLGVRQVLENFAGWIKPGGILIIRVPERRTAYGFLALHTPHFLHVWVKRFVYGMKSAGKPGHDPYPVVYERDMSVESIKQYCERHGFAMEVTANAAHLSKRWLQPLFAVVFALSLGRLAWRYANVTIVIRAGARKPVTDPNF